MTTPWFRMTEILGGVEAEKRVCETFAPPAPGPAPAPVGGAGALRIVVDEVEGVGYEEE